MTIKGEDLGMGGNYLIMWKELFIAGRIDVETWCRRNKHIMNNCESWF